MVPLEGQRSVLYRGTTRPLGLLASHDDDARARVTFRNFVSGPARWRELAVVALLAIATSSALAALAWWVLLTPEFRNCVG